MIKEHTIDAKGKKMGRLASEIAVILQGKKNPAYSQKEEGEDKVIVKNVSKIEVSGKKLKGKIYYRHNTRIGHLKQETMGEVWEKKGPGEVLRRAVMGMLPKNKLRIKRIKRLVMEN
jgi:large subunit ribosomal protein L13